MENPYMYIFVRNDLTHPQQIVQAAHAVDEMNKEFPHESGNYMVLCGVDNEEELMDTSEYLVRAGIDHHMFFEPDVDSHTAIATRPLIGKERKVLKHCQLKR